MILPSLNGRWDKTGKDKPRIRILEVRPRTRPDEDPIAWILVEREEMLEWDRDNTALMRASLRLSFERILPKYDRQYRKQSYFDAGYQMTFNIVSVSSQSCSPGGIFLDLDGLKGNRIGTYLMNDIVEWVKQWPDATVNSIDLRAGQANEKNKARRNRFYEQFGLVFDYTDPATREEGVSRPMLARDLKTVDTWRENIREVKVLDYLGELVYQERSLSHKTKAQKEAIQNLISDRRAAEKHPIWWVLKMLWRTYAGVLANAGIVAVLTAIAWLKFRA